MKYKQQHGKPQSQDEPKTTFIPEIEVPDCSQHKKEILGVSDMKLLAEMIGDLHYETLAELFKQLREKFSTDYKKDNEAGRHQLAMCLWDASIDAGSISLYINNAWQISKPFMRSTPVSSAPPIFKEDEKLK